jgi:hypothetical protein
MNRVSEFVPSPPHELEQELAAARAELAELRAALADAQEEVLRWRGEVLSRWSDAVGTAGAAAVPSGRGSHEVVRLKEELDAMRATVSWRVTAPLRAVQRQRLREWR